MHFSSAEDTMSPSLSIVPRPATDRDPTTDPAGASRPRRLLVLSGDPADGPTLCRLLACATGAMVDSVVEPRARQALRRLSRDSFDAVIIEDRRLDGVAETFSRFADVAPEVPVLVLADAGDAGLVERAIRIGAQDVLLRPELTASRLALAIACGRERTRRLAELRDLSLTDSLTGLCNRRGFRLLAETHARLLRRTRRQSLLLFGDVDDLKGINDRRGHAVGDRALQACAQALRDSLRDSDIVARYGGDEFAALALDVSEGAAFVLLPRIAERLESVSRALRLPAPVTMSVGTASFARGRRTLDEILDHADRAMFGGKRRRTPVAAGHGRDPDAPDAA
jgi:diguanylate cyclase (GGDEF)-like protein